MDGIQTSLSEGTFLIGNHKLKDGLPTAMSYAEVNVYEALCHPYISRQKFSAIDTTDDKA